MDVNIVKNTCLNSVEIFGIIWILRMSLFGQELYHSLTENRMKFRVSLELVLIELRVKKGKNNTSIPPPFAKSASKERAIH